MTHEDKGSVWPPRDATAQRRRSLGTLNAVFERPVRDGVVAGAEAMAASAQGIGYQDAFGWRDLAGGATMTFWMQLVEQGERGFDQRMREILPELAAQQVLEGAEDHGQHFLLRARLNIMTHTTGHAYSIWSAALGCYRQVTAGVMNCDCRIDRRRQLTAKGICPDFAALRSADSSGPCRFRTATLC